jgi:V/A-type H+-transporting ATPase subunit E
MTQSVQELISKIKREGIQAADERAKEIEDLARANAQTIIEDAKKEAEQILAEARKSTERMQNAAETALKQAARDTVLILKKEMERLLNKVALSSVGSALSPEQLGNILKEIILQNLDQKIQVRLNLSDAEALSAGMIAQLQEEMKKRIELIPSGGIGKGLTISFDEGKSSFEFTDRALAEYLTNYLNPHLAELVKQAV